MPRSSGKPFVSLVSLSFCRIPLPDTPLLRPIHVPLDPESLSFPTGFLMMLRDLAIPVLSAHRLSDLYFGSTRARWQTNINPFLCDTNNVSAFWAFTLEESGGLLIAFHVRRDAGVWVRTDFLN